MGKIIENSYTFRLFRKENFTNPFIEGIGSVLDFSTDLEKFYNYDQDEAGADRNSLSADWMQVGKDLKNTIDEHSRSIK